MRALRSRRIPVAALWFLLAGCGRGGEASERAAGETPESSEPGGSGTADSARSAGAGGGSFDHGAFCETLFAPEDVAAITGVGGVTALAPQAGLARGKAICDVEAAGRLEATLAMDCGGADEIVAAWRTLYRDTSPATFAEIDVGRGGVRIAPVAALYQLGFLHDEVDCAVAILTRDLATDRTLELARHAAARLNEANRPR